MSTVGLPVKVEPVDQHGHGHQHHEQDAGRRTAALEHLVRDPAAQQGTRNTRPLVQEVRPGGVVDAEVLGLFQVGRRPVQHTVTDEINEGVGNGDVPQQLVVQHVLDEDLLGGKLLLVAFVIVLRIVVLVLFNGGKPTDCGVSRITKKAITAMAAAAAAGT